MRIVKHLSILSILLVVSPPVFAQNWRTPNPNQPNGYRATCAATHFSGSYKEPSQPSNGYRASEARSHAGMSCYTPPSSSGENSRSSRWGGGSESRWSGGASRWGSGNSRWGNDSGENNDGQRGMFARDNGAHSQEWGEFYNRRFAGNNYNNGNDYGGNNYYASNQSGITPMQAMGVVAGIGAVRRFMQNDAGGARAGGTIGGFERNVDGGLSGDRPGGFDKIYAPE